MKRKIVLSALLVLVLAVSMPAFGADLSDISGHWGEEFILRLVETGAVSGYPDGTFRPDAQITRAEFTVMLLKALEKGSVPSEGVHWATGWKASAVEEGLLYDWEFEDLDRRISRGEIALMVSRATGVSDYADVRKGEFSDGDRLTQEMQTAVNTVYDFGIVSGFDDGTYRAEQSATRAEAATIVIRTVEAAQRANNPRVFTKETLAPYNGKGGKPALVAINGIVYDLTGVSAWSGGEHGHGLQAGSDLTYEFESLSPHNESILKGLVQVGIYKN